MCMGWKLILNRVKLINVDRDKRKMGLVSLFSLLIIFFVRKPYGSTLQLVNNDSLSISEDERCSLVIFIDNFLCLVLSVIAVTENCF